MTLPSGDWADSGHTFELTSVMMYGPQYFAIDNSKPTISIAATGASYPVNRDKITTTDALQVQWRYCQNQQFPNFQYKLPHITSTQGPLLLSPWNSLFQHKSVI